MRVALVELLRVVAGIVMVVVHRVVCELTKLIMSERDGGGRG